jgi:hypothetical protein
MMRTVPALASHTTATSVQALAGTSPEAIVSAALTVCPSIA